VVFVFVLYLLAAVTEMSGLSHGIQLVCTHSVGGWKQTGKLSDQFTSTKMAVFWVVVTHCPDDGGSKDL
jgi:hypothetical protein